MCQSLISSYHLWSPLSMTRVEIGFWSDGPRWFGVEASVSFCYFFATCHVLLSRHMPRVKRWLVRTIYEAYSAYHVSKIGTCNHLIGPRGTHVAKHRFPRMQILTTDPHSSTDSSTKQAGHLLPKLKTSGTCSASQNLTSWHCFIASSLAGPEGPPLPRAAPPHGGDSSYYLGSDYYSLFYKYIRSTIKITNDWK
jgi:hypothetical protein